MRQTIHLILLCAVLAILTGCTQEALHQTENRPRTEELDREWQRYCVACNTKDTDRALAIVDSMEQATLIGTALADYLRGRAYDVGWQMRIAEHFYKKGYEGYVSKGIADFTSQDWYYYADAGYRWAYLRFARGDSEGALGIISELLAQAKGNEAFSKYAEISLLVLMADVQVHLHQFDEARHNWEKAYEMQQQTANGKGMLPYVSMNISCCLFDMGDMEGAHQWLERCAEEFALYEQQGDSLIIEEWRAHIALQRARYLQATGHAADAAAIYASVPHSRIFEPRAYTEAAEYLIAAGRYDEAAYWYEQIDSTYMATDGAQMTFDNIANRLSPRYMAYRKAGRNSEAIAIADSISIAIDSALVWQKKNDAAELAVIYQTHERDLRITDLRFTILLHRVIVVALIVIVLLVAYLLWRSHRYNRILAVKNQRLYEQMQQREKAEDEQREKLQAQPVETLTQSQQLYNRLCELMRNTDIFTDTDTNHETLARLLGTNHTYLYNALRECARQTPTDFINLYRIRHAALLLTRTDNPIGLIVEQSGITNRSTFNRLFREHYSMSPSEYRNAANSSKQF